MKCFNCGENKTFLNIAELKSVCTNNDTSENGEQLF